MRWFLSSFVCLWPFCLSFGDTVWGIYIRSFWDKGKELPNGNTPWDIYMGKFWDEGVELPYWKERGAEKPLSFEELSVTETYENILVVEQEIEEWSWSQCLFALRLLVQRDMAKLKSEGLWEEMLKSVPSERNMSCGRCCSPGDERENIAFDIQFMDKVLCAAYNIETFRKQLKERLGKLTDNVDVALKKVVLCCWRDIEKGGG